MASQASARRRFGLSRRWLHWTQNSDTGYILILSVFVGILVGLVATLYRLALHGSYRLFFTHEHGITNTAQDMLMRLLLPVLGGLIVGFVAYRLLKLRGGHGVPAVIKAVATNQTSFPPQMAAKSALSVITMASGGSAGPEGPIVEIGSVLGSTVGRFGRVTREKIGTLVGCGAASGIAAVFNAPLGGVLFALELILRDFTITRFTPVVLAAVIASVTTQVLLPGQPVFTVPAEVIEAIVPTFPLILAFGLLGPLCALFCALYITGLYRAQDYFQHRVRMPTWLKPALGGLLVGVIALLFPGVQSEGYEFMNDRLFSFRIETAVEARWWLWVSLGLFVYALAKILATIVTLGSGFVGGSFAPAMFIGASLGAAFGVAANAFFPEVTPSPIVFALVGMAGMVGGSLGAPISAMVIVYEVTGGQYQILLPLLITVATAATLTRRLRPGSVYTLSLLRDGFDVEAATQQRDPLAGLTAREAMTREVPFIAPETTLADLLERMTQTDAPAFCVVDRQGRFQGLISMNDLRSILSLSEEMGPLLLAGEIAEPHPRWLSPKSPLTEALDIFGRSDVEAIPVLDPAKHEKVLGVILRRQLLALYNRQRNGEALPDEEPDGWETPNDLDRETSDTPPRKRKSSA